MTEANENKPISGWQAALLVFAGVLLAIPGCAMVVIGWIGSQVAREPGTGIGTLILGALFLTGGVYLAIKAVKNWYGA